MKLTHITDERARSHARILDSMTCPLPSTQVWIQTTRSSYTLRLVQGALQVCSWELKYESPLGYVGDEYNFD